MWKKLLAVTLSTALILPGFGGVSAAEGVSLSSKSGVSLSVSANEMDFGTNVINVVSNKFDLEFDLDDPSNGEIIRVSYIDHEGNTQDLGDSSGSYTIEDYLVDKPGKSKIAIEVEVNVDDQENTKIDKFNLEVNYLNNPIIGARYQTDFVGGKKVEAFSGNVYVQFPKNAYITTSDSTMAPNQTLVFEVEEGEKELNANGSLNDGKTFLSPNYIVTSDGDATSDAMLSAPGYITLSYGYQDVLRKIGNVSSDVSLYNVSVVQYKDSKWTPIGGIVDTKKQTITAPISEFGNYSVVSNSKTYSDLSDWARPALMALAYKGIITANGTGSKLRDDLEDPINRFDYTVMLAKSMNWAPLPYNGHFSDVTVTSSTYKESGYLMAAITNGLVQGSVDAVTEELKLNAGDNLSREEAAVFATRALNLKIATYSEKDAAKTDKDLAKYYNDYSDISAWAKPYVLAVSKAKIMNGDSTKQFNPEDPLTFEEAGALIYKIMLENKQFGK
ncbi:S-layer homology domain-containing protein [Ammoniphilus sp. 3BR4]|uniref:S-layer homology domain-containing protein n=1 Tax=Ammoniphilus sp. 3BR4 TaxID=3158265 RepID=UPI0034650A64